MSGSSEFSTTFDQDLGLGTKRKLLVIVSLLLLSLSFSGAKIEEANTFIFKITFAHQNGLATLLVISVIFLMLRYYNYAKPYHDKLYAIWTKRLGQQPFFYSSNPYGDEDSGIVAMSRSSELDAHFHHNVRRWSFQYVCGWPFTRYIEQYWGYNDNEEEDRYESVNVYKKFGFKIYLMCLWFEAKEQVKSFFTHRENLDILSPYIIGWLAIASFYCSEHLSKLFEIITPNVVN
jgi:hypothetical protein